MTPSLASGPRGIASRGFTLIELMITVAIVAILAAVAIPSYQDSVWKGKRAEAKAAMMKTLQAEERYYTLNNTYVEYLTTATPPSAAFPTFSADNRNNSRYDISTQRATMTGLCTDNDIKRCVIVVATVRGSADPKCGTTLAMDSVGNKIPTTPAACWQ